jgi:predicted DNA-binding transcriptional regulator AlpA
MTKRKLTRSETEAEIARIDRLRGRVQGDFAEHTRLYRMRAALYASLVRGDLAPDPVHGADKHDDQESHAEQHEVEHDEEDPDADLLLAHRDHHITSDELVRRAGISKRRLYNLKNDGLAPRSMRVDGRLWFNAHAAHAWLTERRTRKRCRRGPR